MKEVAGDVTHSLLHLDSRVWRTLQLLLRRPGELTREFIAGRHQLYIPPFRLYLAVSILYFALSALLPESGASTSTRRATTRTASHRSCSTARATGAAGAAGTANPEAGAGRAERRHRRAAQGTRRGGRLAGENRQGAEGRQQLQGQDLRRHAAIRRTSSRRSAGLRADASADGGRRFAEHFAATAPKLMFLFLPLMAGGRAALLLAAAAPVRRAPRAVPAQPRLHVPADRRSPRS